MTCCLRSTQEAFSVSSPVPRIDYGLRDYGTAEWAGGDRACDHQPPPWADDPGDLPGVATDAVRSANMAKAYARNGGVCRRCGATRVDQQIGLEFQHDCGAWMHHQVPCGACYVCSLRAVFREVHRVLRDDGVAWLVLGDSYANDTKWGGASSGKHRTALHGDSGIGRRRRQTGLKSKDLMGIPWRTAFALQADGWYLRADVIWSKTNSMPENVGDRPNKSHEYVFLLAKAERYYYDRYAILEPDNGKPSGNGFARPERKRHDGRGQPGRWHPGNGRNKRSVWTLTTSRFKGEHYATFPLQLVEPMILASTAPQACERCGKPWRRVVEPTGHVNRREAAHVPNNTKTKTDSTRWAPTTRPTSTFVADCRCEDALGTGQCVVLDPFGGSGTTAVAAIKHGRHAVLIELNRSYVELQRERASTVQPVLPLV